MQAFGLGDARAPREKKHRDNMQTPHGKADRKRKRQERQPERYHTPLGTVIKQNEYGWYLFATAKINVYWLFWYFWNMLKHYFFKNLRKQKKLINRTNCKTTKSQQDGFPLLNYWRLSTQINNFLFCYSNMAYVTFKKNKWRKNPSVLNVCVLLTYCSGYY